MSMTQPPESENILGYMANILGYMEIKVEELSVLAS